MEHKKSPLQSFVNKMNKRLNESNVTTQKLKQIIEFAHEGRAGLLQPGGHSDSDWWANKAINDFTEIIVRANFKAHQILNPDLVPDDLDEQIKNALLDSEKLIQERDSKTVNFKNFLDSYNKESDLVNKLTLIHNFVDDTIYKEDVIIQLLEHFNDANFHLSEIKTVLLVSKPYKNNKEIKVYRKELLETYNNKIIN